MSIIQLQFVVQLPFWMVFIPPVYASQRDFPNISFQSFSNFISSTFHPDISLATVLFLLFSLTENINLLNLHSRQQQQLFPSEKVTKYTCWMSALVNTLCDQLDEETLSHLFLNFGSKENTNDPTTVPMDIDVADVKMVVLDGIVMGPKVSFFGYYGLYITNIQNICIALCI